MMNDTQAQELLLVVKSYINKVVGENRGGEIKCAPAKVISIPISNNHLVEVRLISSGEDSSQNFTIENRTREELVINDIVWVAWWDTLTNAAVLWKNDSTNDFIGGGGGGAPSPHASTHSATGTDAITPASIGAATTSHTHTPASIGAATTSHTHAPSDLTSAVPVTKGGTGAATAADARTALGITPANIGAAATSHTHTPASIGAAELNSFEKVAPAQISSVITGITSDLTLRPAHAGRFFYVNPPSGTTYTITIPDDASENFPDGTEMEFVRWGAGEVAFAPASGVTLASLEDARTIAGRYGCVSLKKIFANYWLLAGALQ